MMYQQGYGMPGQPGVAPGQMAGMGMLGKMKAMKNAGADPEQAMAGMGMPDMNALAGMGRGGKSTKTSSVKKKFKQRKKRK